MLLWLIGLIAFAAAFTQSATGFGSALVAMSLLPGLIGIQAAAPLVALSGFVGTTSLWLYYRDRLNLSAVGRLAIASVLAIPIGTWTLDFVPERVALRGLGLLIVGYVIYDFWGLRLPELRSLRWAYGFGFLSGLLSGAFNTGGPPVVVYAHCRRWEPQAFKSNLNSFFVINSCVNVVSHTLQGNYTPAVVGFATYALPAFLLGLVAGVIGSSRLDAKTFRKLVLALLLVTGIKLLI